MRRVFSLLLCLMMVFPLLPLHAHADAYLTVMPPEETVRPGKAIGIVFEAPAPGEASIHIVDEQNQVVSTVTESFAASLGRNLLWWNGTWQGVPAPEGGYSLVVQLNGDTASVPVHIGAYAPYMYEISPIRPTVEADRDAQIDFVASVDGTFTGGVLLADGSHFVLRTVAIDAGQITVFWDGMVNGQRLPAGEYTYTLLLTDETGFNSTEEHVKLTVAALPTATPAPTPEVTPTPEPTATPESAEDIVVEDVILGANGEEIDLQEDGTIDPDATEEDAFTPDDTASFTPSYTSPYQNFDNSSPYWGTPMDITDEEAVWAALMAPMTVVDGNERDQVNLYAEPSTDSKVVGLVTCETQGVRVIEKLDNGWSLIECYSSSFYGTKIPAWNLLVQGYIKTSRLKEMKPADEYGIVVDKLTQHLYIFKEGKLFTTLQISTGISNKTQPFNETRSGEFFLTSPVGDFRSDNMVCGMALRFNDGDLLHEVPHVINADGTKNYRYCEPKLGTKASHGCIRVQRKKTPEGVNMAWLWNNRNYRTRLLIWEDWQGRQIEYPADDAVLYYNAAGGSYYHSQDFCYSATNKGVVLSPFTWAELENDPYADLEYCPYCVPLRRKATIDAINEKYAPGGDHDPILTEARREWLESR